MKITHIISFILVIVGGLNWGLVGLGMWFGADWNVVNQLFGTWPMVESTIYVLVGLSAIVLVGTHRKDCTCCKADAPKM